MSLGPMTMPGKLESWSGLLPASYRSSLAARCAPTRREPNLSWCRLRNPPSRSREGVVDDRWKRGLSIPGQCRLGQVRPSARSGQSLLLPEDRAIAEMQRYARNFHNQLKAKLLREKVALQVVRET